MTQVPGAPPPTDPGAYHPLPKPGLLQAAVVLTLISGIVNILNSGLLAAALLMSCFGAICIPVAVLPLTLGIFEIIYAMKLLPARPEPAQPNQTLAILQICSVLWGGVISVVAGVLALVAYNDLSVRAWFDAINRRAPAPAPVAELPPPPPLPPAEGPPQP